jgi:tRNA 2-thiouridine synthesizing protein A
MSDIKISHTLDAKKLSCPLPILKTKKAIENVEVGEYLEVLATDPGSVTDFEAWTRSTGHELVDHSIDGDIYRYIIKRTK